MKTDKKLPFRLIVYHLYDLVWHNSCENFFNPDTPVAQKIADQRWLIANSAKIGTFFISNDVIKG